MLCLSCVSNHETKEKQICSPTTYTLCIDLIGSYMFKQAKNQTEKLWALTMIDPSTVWFDMTTIETKKIGVIANKIEQTCLTQYPWPTQVIFNQGMEVTAELKKRLQQEYGIA